MENLHLKHRCYEFESQGKIVYNPPRKGGDNPWSAIIEAEQDLADYFRYLFLIEFNIGLMHPGWKAHISLFRGPVEYRPEMEKYWKEKDGDIISFVYTKEVFWNNEHVWVNTYFPEFFELREKMGLSDTHIDNQSWGHITIGKFRKPDLLTQFIDYNDPLPPYRKDY